MTWDQWLAGVPSVIRDDRLWNVEAYRLGLFLSDLAWNDVTKLMKGRRTIGLADQLYRAGGSISANLAQLLNPELS